MPTMNEDERTRCVTTQRVNCKRETSARGAILAPCARGGAAALPEWQPPARRRCHERGQGAPGPPPLRPSMVTHSPPCRPTKPLARLAGWTADTREHNPRHASSLDWYVPSTT